MFPVDKLRAVSPSELEQWAQKCTTELLYSNPDSLEQFSLPDSTQVDISISTVGLVPLYGCCESQKVLALFAPGDPITPAALFLLGQWWSMGDILRTTDSTREGLLQVDTLGERIVLYVLNRIIYRVQEMSPDELPFLCHGAKDFAKILWQNGEAVGFYSVKPTGSSCHSSSSRKYSLPVMDSMFVRKCHRGKGFGLQMLEDYVDSFKDDYLGLKYPLTTAMYKVCQRYLRDYPGDAELLWEVDSCRINQRTSVASRLQSLSLTGVSRTLQSTEQSSATEAVRQTQTVEEVTVVTSAKGAGSIHRTAGHKTTDEHSSDVRITEEVTLLKSKQPSTVPQTEELLEMNADNRTEIVVTELLEDAVLDTLTSLQKFEEETVQPDSEEISQNLNTLTSTSIPVENVAPEVEEGSQSEEQHSRERDHDSVRPQATVTVERVLRGRTVVNIPQISTVGDAEGESEITQETKEEEFAEEAVSLQRKPLRGRQSTTTPTRPTGVSTRLKTGQESAIDEDYTPEHEPGGGQEEPENTGTLDSVKETDKKECTISQDAREESSPEDRHQDILSGKDLENNLSPEIDLEEEKDDQGAGEEHGLEHEPLEEQSIADEETKEDSEQKSLPGGKEEAAQTIETRSLSYTEESPLATKADVVKTRVLRSAAKSAGVVLTPRTTRSGKCLIEETVETITSKQGRKSTERKLKSQSKRQTEEQKTSSADEDTTEEVQQDITVLTSDETSKTGLPGEENEERDNEDEPSICTTTQGAIDEGGFKDQEPEDHVVEKEVKEVQDQRNITVKETRAAEGASAVAVEAQEDAATPADVQAVPQSTTEAGEIKETDLRPIEIDCVSQPEHTTEQGEAEVEPDKYLESKEEDEPMPIVETRVLRSGKKTVTATPAHKRAAETDTNVCGAEGSLSEMVDDGEPQDEHQTTEGDSQLTSFQSKGAEKESGSILEAAENTETEEAVAAESIKESMLSEDDAKAVVAKSQCESMTEQTSQEAETDKVPLSDSHPKESKESPHTDHVSKDKYPEENPGEQGFSVANNQDESLPSTQDEVIETRVLRSGAMTATVVCSMGAEEKHEETTLRTDAEFPPLSTSGATDNAQNENLGENAFQRQSVIEQRMTEAESDKGPEYLSEESGNISTEKLSKTKSSKEISDAVDAAEQDSPPASVNEDNTPSSTQNEVVETRVLRSGARTTSVASVPRATRRSKRLVVEEIESETALVTQHGKSPGRRQTSRSKGKTQEVTVSSAKKDTPEVVQQQKSETVTEKNIMEPMAAEEDILKSNDQQLDFAEESILTETNETAVAIIKDQILTSAEEKTVNEVDKDVQNERNPIKTTDIVEIDCAQDAEEKKADVEFVSMSTSGAIDIEQTESPMEMDKESQSESVMEPRLTETKAGPELFVEERVETEQDNTDEALQQISTETDKELVTTDVTTEEAVLTANKEVVDIEVVVEVEDMHGKRDMSDITEAVEEKREEAPSIDDVEDNPLSTTDAESTEHTESPMKMDGESQSDSLVKESTAEAEKESEPESLPVETEGDKDAQAQTKDAPEVPKEVTEEASSAAIIIQEEDISSPDVDVYERRVLRSGSKRASMASTPRTTRRSKRLIDEEASKTPAIKRGRQSIGRKRVSGSKTEEQRTSSAEEDITEEALQKESDVTSPSDIEQSLPIETDQEIVTKDATSEEPVLIETTEAVAVDDIQDQEPILVEEDTLGKDDEDMHGKRDMTEEEPPVKESDITEAVEEKREEAPSIDDVEDNPLSTTDAESTEHAESPMKMDGESQSDSLVKESTAEAEKESEPESLPVETEGDKDAQAQTKDAPEVPKEVTEEASSAAIIIQEEDISSPDVDVYERRVLRSGSKRASMASTPRTTRRSKRLIDEEVSKTPAIKRGRQSIGRKRASGSKTEEQRTSSAEEDITEEALQKESDVTSPSDIEQSLPIETDQEIVTKDATSEEPVLIETTEAVAVDDIQDQEPILVEEDTLDNDDGDMHGKRDMTEEEPPVKESDITEAVEEKREEAPSIDDVEDNPLSTTDAESTEHTESPMKMDGESQSDSLVKESTAEAEKESEPESLPVETEGDKDAQAQTKDAPEVPKEVTEEASSAAIIIQEKNISSPDVDVYERRVLRSGSKRASMASTPRTTRRSKRLIDEEVGKTPAIKRGRQSIGRKRVSGSKTEEQRTSSAEEDITEEALQKESDVTSPSDIEQSLPIETDQEIVTKDATSEEPVLRETTEAVAVDDIQDQEPILVEEDTLDKDDGDMHGKRDMTEEEPPVKESDITEAVEEKREEAPSTDDVEDNPLSTTDAESTEHTESPMKMDGESQSDSLVKESTAEAEKESEPESLPVEAEGDNDVQTIEDVAVEDIKDEKEMLVGENIMDREDKEVHSERSIIVEDSAVQEAITEAVEEKERELATADVEANPLSTTELEVTEHTESPMKMDRESQSESLMEESTAETEKESEPVSIPVEEEGIEAAQADTKDALEAPEEPSTVPIVIQKENISSVHTNAVETRVLRSSARTNSVVSTPRTTRKGKRLTKVTIKKGRKSTGWEEVSISKEQNQEQRTTSVEEDTVEEVEQSDRAAPENKTSLPTEAGENKAEPTEDSSVTEANEAVAGEDVEDQEATPDEETTSDIHMQSEINITVEDTTFEESKECFINESVLLSSAESVDRKHHTGMDEKQTESENVPEEAAEAAPQVKTRSLRSGTKTISPTKKHRHAAEKDVDESETGNGTSAFIDQETTIQICEGLTTSAPDQSTEDSQCDPPTNLSSHEETTLSVNASDCLKITNQSQTSIEALLPRLSVVLVDLNKTQHLTSATAASEPQGISEEKLTQLKRNPREDITDESQSEINRVESIPDLTALDESEANNITVTEHSSAEETRGENSTEETRGENSTEETRGENSTEETRGENSTEETRGENSTEETRGENSTEETRGENSTEETRGENSTEETRGENSTEETRGENSTEETRGENSTEETRGENSTEETRGENSTEETRGENSTEETRGENSTEAMEESPEADKVQMQADTQEQRTSKARRSLRKRPRVSYKDYDDKQEMSEYTESISSQKRPQRTRKSVVTPESDEEPSSDSVVLSLRLDEDEEESASDKDPLVVSGKNLRSRSIPSVTISPRSTPRRSATLSPKEGPEQTRRQKRHSAKSSPPRSSKRQRN